MEKYKFKKSTCERYDIRLADGWGWAIITIDENGGLFNAQSDYGNYSYSWPCHGRKSFKHFIIELSRDKSYFLGKVAESNYYYQDKTEKAWRKEVLRARKEKELNKEEAREVWNEIIEFDYSCAESLECEVYSNHVISKYYCEPWYSFECVKGFAPGAHEFFKKIMPIFADILSKEIEKEEKSA